MRPWIVVSAHSTMVSAGGEASLGSIGTLVVVVVVDSSKAMCRLCTNPVASRPTYQRMSVVMFQRATTLLVSLQNNVNIVRDNSANTFRLGRTSVVEANLMTDMSMVEDEDEDE